MDMSLSKLQEVVKGREAWYVTVHGVEKSQTRPSDEHFHLQGLGDGASPLPLGQLQTTVAPDHLAFKVSH